MKQTINTASIRTTGRKIKKNWLYYVALALGIFIIFWFAYSSMSGLFSVIGGKYSMSSNTVYVKFISQEDFRVFHGMVEIPRIAGIEDKVYELPNGAKILYKCDNGASLEFKVVGTPTEITILDRKAQVNYQVVNTIC